MVAAGIAWRFRRAEVITQSPGDWRSLEGTTVTVRGMPRMDGELSALVLKNREALIVTDVTWSREQLQAGTVTITGVVGPRIYLVPQSDGSTRVSMSRPDVQADGTVLHMAYGYAWTLKSTR
ncbi:MAG TPA: hypothetical protein VK157_10410 [Phycisphaerales bacterium]|nr:hypothetical protein [Phycisphaerales bacterium]